MRHRTLRLVALAATIALVGAGAYLFVWRLPEVSVRRASRVTDSQREQLLQEARRTNAQVLGGAALLLGLFFTWWNLRIAQQGQITERFTRAVDQLGSDKIEQRVGAIYALERLATD